MYVLTFQNCLCSYACSYGPEDKRGKQAVKRRTSFAKKRGCQCRFIVKAMGKYPKIAILTYNMYEHEDGQGWTCHGRLDTSGEARSMHQPRISRDIVSHVESCFYLDVPVESVCKMKIKKNINMDVKT